MGVAFRPRLVGLSSAVCCGTDRIDLIRLIFPNSGASLFVSALLLPVLRLNLMLPLRLQGLGTGGWLSLTRWGFPTQFRQLTNARRVPSARKWKPVVPVSQLALWFYCIISCRLRHVLFLMTKCLVRNLRHTILSAFILALSWG